MRSRAGMGSSRSSAGAVISMPGVQKPHCSALRAIEGALQVGDLAALGQALDGLDLGAVGLRGEHRGSRARSRRRRAPCRRRTRRARSRCACRSARARAAGSRRGERAARPALHALAVDGERRCRRTCSCPCALTSASAEHAPGEHLGEVQLGRRRGVQVGARGEIGVERASGRIDGLAPPPAVLRARARSAPRAGAGRRRRRTPRAGRRTFRPLTEPCAATPTMA